MNTKKSESIEQQLAEEEVFLLIEQWLGCKVDRNPKVKMIKNPTIHIEPDFYSEADAVIGEIFAHIGKVKRGQHNKLSNDILKMLLIEKDRECTYRKIIVVCDDETEKALEGKSALAECVKQFGIEVKRVEISKQLRESIMAAQKRQIMVNR